MKILYLHQHYTTPDMPGGTRSYEMSRRLAAMGHEVEILAADRSASSHRRGWRMTEEAGCRVHWFGVPYSNRFGASARMRAFARFAVACTHKALTIAADVVLATSAPLSIAVPALAAHRLLGAPYVFEVRDLWPETPIAMGVLTNPVAIRAARRLEATAYRRAAHVVALSPDMKAGVMRCGIPDDRVSVIPNSCDFDLFSATPEEALAFRQRFDWLKDRPLVVYTGALGRVNGVGYLAEVAAAAMPRFPQMRFLVVGDGCEHDAIRQLARKRAVWERNFFMLPPLAKREMPAVLAAADIATSTTIDLPALWSNSANKVFDALAAGTPIAINHEGWLADLIRRYGAGLVLPSGSPQQAAEMLACATNRQWRQHAGRAAKRLGRERFDRDRLAVQLEAVLAKAAGHAPRSASPCEFSFAESRAA